MKRTAIAALLLTQCACGTLLYPERQNQPHSGQLDPTVLLLNTAGLFVFIVPGLLAFAVDFSNGTIFLPNTTYAAADESETYRAVPVNNALDADTINAIVSSQLSIDNVLQHDALVATAIDRHQLGDIFKTLWSWQDPGAPSNPQRL